MERSDPGSRRNRRRPPWSAAVSLPTGEAVRSPSDHRADWGRDSRLHRVHDILQVSIEDVFLAVGQLQELFPGAAEGRLRQVVTELSQADLAGGAPRRRG